MAKQYEGTWEEVRAHASEFDGRRLRVTLLDDKKTKAAGEPTEVRSGEGINSERFPGVIAGRQHGKPFKEWPSDVGATDISSEEFDAFEHAIAENRAMRRAVAEDSCD